MKKLLYLALAMIATAASYAIRAPRAALPNPEQAVASFHYMSGVSNTDFRDSGATSLLKTYSITSPGTYIFVQDIASVCASGNVSGEGKLAALFINTNDLTLDLGSKSLSYGGSSTDIIGIEVASSKNNISIKNGNVIDFTGQGIYINKGCNNIRISDMTITGTKQGIYFAGATGAGNEIHDSVIRNCMSVGNVGKTGYVDAIGIQFDYCWNILIDNCMFSGNNLSTKTNGISGVGNSGIGALVRSCTGITFKNCDASNNEGVNAVGFDIKNATGTEPSHAISLVNCVASGNYASSTDSTAAKAYGIRVSTSHGCYFDNCVLSHNEGADLGFGCSVTSSNYNMFKNCKAMNNVCQTAAATAASGTDPADGGYGFYLSQGSGNYLESCIGSGSRGSDSTNVFASGFHLLAELYSLLNKCEALSNGDTTNAATGAGFVFDNNGANGNRCQQCVARDCAAYNNLSSSSGTAYGFYDPNTANNKSDILITNCMAFGNRKNSSADGNHKNYSFTYPNPGEAIYITPEQSAGQLSDITSLGTYENISLKAD